MSANQESRHAVSCPTTFSTLLGPNIFHNIRTVLRNWLSWTAHACHLQNLFMFLWLRASAAVWIGSSFFWDVTQSRLVGSYQRFGTPVGSHLQGMLDPRSWEPIGCPETSVTTNIRRVTSQKNENLMCMLILYSWRTVRFQESLDGY
jgi:hypothetical protein